MVGDGSPEMGVLVIYDVEDDRIRNRVAEACLDYGLERIQYSAFLGRINRNRRQELSLRLQAEIGSELARLRVIPLLQESLREMWVLDQYGEAESRDGVPDRPRIRLVRDAG